jgi:hypothetical protein
MFSVTKDWNPRQARLAELLRSDAGFSEAIDLCVSMHGELHDLDPSGAPTFYRELISPIGKDEYAWRPPRSFASIAWNLWHITRIEDAIANILIGDGPQVLDASRLAALGVSVTDTGNAFSEDDVDRFSAAVSVKELLKYRKAVGARTRKILGALGPEDRRRKPAPERLARIMAEGVLTAEPESAWLLDFWSKKTVAGLLTMPVTRHQIVHLNDCLAIHRKHEAASRSARRKTASPPLAKL